MRVIAFVLAVLINFLILEPCADFPDYEENENHVQLQDTHQHNSNAKDDCTAFCVCSCCGVSLQVPELFFYEKAELPKTYVSASFRYSTFYKSLICFNIWEPPIA